LELAKMRIKEFFKAAVIAVAAVSICTVSLAEEAAKEMSPDAPVAVVNGSSITKADYDLAVKAYMRNISQSTGGMHGGTVEANDQIKGEILDQMINREVLYTTLEKMDLAGVDEKTATEFEKAKSQFATEEEYKEALKSDGLTEESLKNLIHRRFLLETYINDKVKPTVEVTGEEVAKFYEENPSYFEKPEMVSAHHVLISCDPKADEATKAEAKKKAEEARKRIESGEEFEAVAKDVSDCPSAAQGGDLGEFTKGRMVKPFEDAAFGLNAGQMSEIVETQFGYHVIRVDKHDKEGKVSLEEASPKIKEHLTNVKANEALKAKVEELKKDAKIEIK